MTPLVSVCVPTYNRKELLATTLESLRCQSFTDFELIVCDDASSDGTFEYLSSLGWERLTVLRNERNLNLPGTMTRLFRKARGKYVGMQHDHDIYEPQFLEKMVELLERHPTAGFGCCAYRTVNADGSSGDSPDSEESRLFPPGGLLPGRELVQIIATRVHTPIPAMATMFRRDVVEKAGGYRPDWGLASDEDLYRRVAAISDVAFCRDRLFRMRLRPRERNHLLGSWKNICDVFALRRDTAQRYLEDGVLRRTFRAARMAALMRKALIVESLFLWIHGETGRLHGMPDARGAGDGREALDAFSRAAARRWIEFLSATPGLGKRFGEIRANLRNRPPARERGGAR